MNPFLNTVYMVPSCTVHIQVPKESTRQQRTYLIQLELLFTLGSILSSPLLLHFSSSPFNLSFLFTSPSRLSPSIPQCSSSLWTDNSFKPRCCVRVHQTNLSCAFGIHRRSPWGGGSRILPSSTGWMGGRDSEEWASKILGNQTEGEC